MAGVAVWAASILALSAAVRDTDYSSGVLGTENVVDVTRLIEGTNAQCCCDFPEPAETDRSKMSRSRKCEVKRDRSQTCEERTKFSPAVWHEHTQTDGKKCQVLREDVSDVISRYGPADYCKGRDAEGGYQVVAPARAEEARWVTCPDDVGETMVTCRYQDSLTDGVWEPPVKCDGASLSIARSSQGAAHQTQHHYSQGAAQQTQHHAPDGCKEGDYCAQLYSEWIFIPSTWCGESAEVTCSQDGTMPRSHSVYCHPDGNFYDSSNVVAGCEWAQGYNPDVTEVHSADTQDHTMGGDCAEEDSIDGKYYLEARKHGESVLVDCIYNSYYSTNVDGKVTYRNGRFADATGNPPACAQRRS